jgi:UMF1 family MFS transporter
MNLLQSRRAPWHEVLGWAMFDFANSSYTTVVITAVYSSFFISTIVPADWAMRDSLWAIGIIISTAFALLLAPLIGAVCDYSGRKKQYLVVSSVICAGATMAMGLAGPGQVWLALLLLVASNTAFMISEALCGSFLPDVADEDSMGRISGLGWGIGYFGGLASVILATQFIVKGDPGSAQYVLTNRWAMVATGLFFLIAATPTFLLVRNRTPARPGWEGASLRRLIGAGFAELAQTANTARQHPALFKFLFAFMVYMAGLDAVIKFVGIYAREEVQLTTGEFGTLFLVLQVSAAAGAVGFGFLEKFIGPRRTVLASLGIWIVGTLGIHQLAALAQLTGLPPKTVFFGLGLLAGAAIGSTQASSRTVVGLLAPADKSAQMFGFWSMFMRAGSILGASFGFVSDFTGRRSALLLVAAFFIVGGAMLWRIPIDQAARDKVRPEEDAEPTAEA